MRKSLKNFRNWTAERIEIDLDVKYVEDASLINPLSKIKGEVPEKYLEDLEYLRTTLRLKFPNWNEQELVVRFIAPLLNTIKFEGRGYNFFLERDLKGHFRDFELEGIVDGVIATGMKFLISLFMSINVIKWVIQNH